MIRIVEIQLRITQGVTRPWLCKGDDGHQYVVKRLNATVEGCVFEWVAANLGQRLGLPIPDCCQVIIDESLVGFNIELENELGAGVAFASRFKPSLQEVNRRFLSQCEDDVLRTLYVFDHWVQNNDRTLTDSGGNPNLFVDINRGDLVVLDHNLAFSRDYDASAHRQLHVAADAWGRQLNLFDRQRYQKLLDHAAADIQPILASLPSEWRERLANTELKRIEHILSLPYDHAFWEAL